MRPLVLALALLLWGCSSPLEGPVAAWRQPESPARVLWLGDDSHLGAPEGLRATSGEYRMIPLKWDPVLSGGVAGYLVESAARREGPFERLAVIEGRGRLAYIDGEGDAAGKGAMEPALGDGVTRFYRVRSFDAESRVSPEASVVVVATTAPLPEPPDGIIAYSRQPREIPLSWRAVRGPAVGGYQIERSPAPEGPYEVVAKLEGRHTTAYVDSGLGDLRVFYYRLRTTSRAGLPGSPSEPVRAVTKPAPLPPLGLHVSAQRLGANVLRWEANVEDDLVEYQLLRIPNGGEASLVARVAVDELEAADTEVGAGQELLYVAVARDRDGLTSHYSLPIPATSEGYDLRAEASPRGILLSWDPRADEGYVDALIERSGPLWMGPIYRSRHGRFLDEDVATARRYEYQVTLERLDGSLAPISRPVSIELSEAVARAD